MQMLPKFDEIPECNFLCACDRFKLRMDLGLEALGNVPSLLGKYRLGSVGVVITQT